MAEYRPVAGYRPVRLLVLGDSLSEGVGDPAPGWAGLRGELRGWVGRLAQACAAAGRPMQVTNLAVRGGDVAAVRSGQLPAAPAGFADASVCFVGVNDVFRPGFDVDTFRADLDAVVRALVARTVGPVLLMSLPDVACPLPLPSAARSRVRGRISAVNACVREQARTHGVELLDIEPFVAELAEGGLLSIDRLHPGARGHQRLAAEVLTVLARHPALQLQGVPPPEPARSRPGTRGRVARSELAHALWLLRFGPGLVWRGGTVPDLLRGRDTGAVPRSNRPRRRGRPVARPSSDAGPDGAERADGAGRPDAAGRPDGSGRAVISQRVEAHADGDWVVRPVTGERAVKRYRCPGCDHEVAAGVPHLVAWPAGDRLLGPGEAERRHWHTPCWRARSRRGPRAARAARQDRQW